MCQVKMWSTHTIRLVEPQGLKTWHNFNEGGQEVKAVMETPEHLYNETQNFSAWRASAVIPWPCIISLFYMNFHLLLFSLS